MFNINQLTTYASAPDPEDSIPLSVRLNHDEWTLTIFDLYPKAKYHFLILPRIPFPLPSPTQPLLSTHLSSLSSLLAHSSSSSTLQVLLKLQEASKETVEIIEDEMMKTEGRKWAVEAGFHSVPSMNRLHLHVISSDLMSPSLKTKKHYQSFHPTHGFFIPLTDVIDMVRNGKKQLPLSPSAYEALLRLPLKCHRCGQEQKDMPTLKRHLEDEWVKEGRKGKGRS